MEEKGGDYRQLESAPPRPEYLAMKSASIEANFYHSCLKITAYP